MHFPIIEKKKINKCRYVLLFNKLLDVIPGTFTRSRAHTYKKEYRKENERMDRHLCSCTIMIVIIALALSFLSLPRLISFHFNNPSSKKLVTSCIGNEPVLFF